jgi:CheY-like chemotaxis protein
VLPHIFEPFFTTKELGKGTGLGLATVFGIVKQHQGCIEIANNSGRGARFDIFLPLGEGTSVQPGSVAKKSKPVGGTETILLVEDESSVRDLMSRTLKWHGYRTLEASNGEEAMALWREHRGEVALLLTDLVMPGGMSGQQLARQLQADNPRRLKVIFTSGYSAEIVKRGLALEPGERFIQKPCPPQEMLEILRHCLDTEG